MNYKRIAKMIIPQACVVPAIRAYRFWNRLTSGRKLIDTEYKVITFSRKNVNCFFGYYDISPFGTNGRVIYHEIDEKKGTCSIVMNNIEGTNRKVIATTNAWNWQQGSRLRWFPNQQNVVVFNDMIDNQYVSRRINVCTGEENHFQFPLYDISEDGKFGLSLDFTRLGYKRPGYGYTNLPFDTNEDIRDSGIELYDLKEHKLLKTLTYKEIAKSIGKPTDNYISYYLNHLSFSPSGNEFLFFFLQDEVNNFKASLLVYKISEDKIVPLETELKVSHYDWLNDDTIICTACDNKGNFHYYSYDVKSAKKVEVSPTSLNVDGHPTYISKDQIVTDTYPDTKGYQHLKLVSLKDDSYEIVASIFDYKVKDAERRTDLHPRYYNKMISFDANTSGLRSFNILFLR